MESIEDTQTSQNNLQIVQTPRINNNHDSTVPSRLERLLRERELRKSSRSQYANEGIRDGYRDSDVFGNGVELCLSDGDKRTQEGELIEGLAAASVSNGFERQDGRLQKQRLLVVANRLPVSAVRKGEDSWALDVSVGGLVSALLGVNEFEANWIGWAGVNVADEIGQRSLTEALAEKRCIPVFLDQEIVHQYYNGYCNNILWPLFHYLPLPQEDRLATTRSFQSQFAAYKEANQMFADVVNEHYQGKLTRVAAFPIGIDSDRFIRALELPPVKYHIKELQERFTGRKVMLGVDRLDMIKGIPQKILAFEKFLEENPDWHDKIKSLRAKYMKLWDASMEDLEL